MMIMLYDMCPGLSVFPGFEKKKEGRIPPGLCAAPLRSFFIWYSYGKSEKEEDCDEPCQKGNPCHSA